MPDLPDRCLLPENGVRPWRLAFCLALAFSLPSRAAPADLTTLSLEQLMDLPVVSAARYEQRQTEVAAAASILTRADIDAFGWRTLGDALASLPGLYQTYDRQYGYLGARGYGPPGDLTARVLVTIDGNRVNDPLFDSGPIDRAFPLDMGLVERIEFIPGPGGAVYGQNAMFGVVNVITRSGADLKGAEIETAWQAPQNLREGRATWGRRWDDGSDVLLSVSGMRARGEDLAYGFGDTGVSGVAPGLDGERGRQAFLRASSGPLFASLAWGSRRKDDPTAGFRSDPLVGGQYQADRYAVGQLQYQDRVTDALLLTGRLFGGTEDYRSHLSYDGAMVSYPSTSGWHGGELRLVADGSERHRLLFGIEAQQNTRVRQREIDLASDVTRVDIRTGGHRLGLYGQDEWRITPALAAIVGARFDHDDVSGNAASPRAGLIWQRDPATTLKLLHGRARRSPNAYESAYHDEVSLTANPSLPAEHVETWEAVADRRVFSDLAVRVSLYRWHMHNLIHLGNDEASGLSQYQASSSVQAQGAEISADKTWEGGARLRGNVSVQDVSADRGERPANSPVLLARLNFSTPLRVLPGGHTGWELRYDGPRRAIDGSTLGGYLLVNARAVCDLKPIGAELLVTAHNLLDRRYAQPAADTNWQTGLEQDGRSLRIGLRWRL
ncbi:TonB-dependent receptor plug domain-containing protein [Derxia gummosa]|uniref:TonB-dependent receptor plug domain-containing protein n=1 Tax=Derxia gummosa DSM 723 TaxID=1121388 RepID=A0A8B6XAX8_9BURK|nr:TonB-dependent receptor [Derxia gummosa]